MSKLSEDIFKGAKHFMSSPYGPRTVISTLYGKTSSFHYGTDYGTYGVKLPQYCVAEGSVISCGKDTAANGYGLYAWISYPSLGVKMLHYHLDSVNVKSGQKVVKGTLIGYTGKTGRATGIHLHLGIKLLSTGSYTDPEIWSKNNYGKSNLKPGDYKVTADILNVRKGAGTGYSKKNFSQLTKSAQTKILALKGVKSNGYVKGLTFTCSEVKEADGYTWGKTPSGWVALNYCERI